MLRISRNLHYLIGFEGQVLNASVEIGHSKYLSFNLFTFLLEAKRLLGNGIAIFSSTTNRNYLKKVYGNLHQLKVDERKIVGSFEMHIVQPPQMKLFSDE